ncbi:ankyrin repeat domain protein [Nitzschia inconspicua]|uniref:Ankyrin repeat domain protein n=1 Tax=Nitzschia inconspicua TaxID=303405 RepID=A0A9K3Q632_9STRA|nr:ankyrin repeat domain protein [Nitzschia inconspicua]
MITYSSQPTKISRARTPTQTATPNNNNNNNDAQKEDRQQPVTPPTSKKSPQLVTPRPLSPSEQTTSSSGASSQYSQTKRSNSQGFFPTRDDKVMLVRQQQQQHRQDSYDQPESATIVGSNSHHREPVDMTNLLKHIERREWMQVVKFFEKHPHTPAQKSPSGNLPLHEALKHNPPLPVVNLLLEMYEGALRTTGAHGYLPLHVACNCRHIGVDVVTRLVVGYAGALRTREPTRDCLPLHLAVQTGASEEVLMELLTNYPEASFVQDNSGKIPLDYAQESVHHHNRSIVALETAPILLAAAQAAQTRVSKEYEFKMNGLREAHKEFVRQLEERFEEERTSFLQDQIQFSNDLAHEKERNISLAEMLMDTKTSEKNLLAQRDQLQVQLDRGMKEFRTMIETQEAELRLVLEEADLLDMDAEASKDRSLPGEEAATDKSLKGRLQSLAKSFNESKSESAALKEELLKQQEMVRHLNELLTTKDDELAVLKERLTGVESSYNMATARANQLSDERDVALKDLSSLRQELEELRQLSHENQNQLEKFKHTISVQDNRLGTVKNIVATLSFNMESWEKEDDERDRDRVVATKDQRVSDDKSTDCNSTLDGDVDHSNGSGNCMAGTTVIITKINEEENENTMNKNDGHMDETTQHDDLNSVPTEVERNGMEDEFSHGMTSEDSMSVVTGTAAVGPMTLISNIGEEIIISDSELVTGEMEV